MHLKLLLLLALILATAGCEQSGFSTSHALPDASIDGPDEPGKVESVEEEPAAKPQADEQPSSAVAPVAESQPPAANQLLPMKDVTFDDIKFEIAKDSKFERKMLTPKIEELFGRNIRIRGYILPTFQQSGIRSFVLVRDNMECCFGPGAAIYDCIVVDMVPGQSAEFTTRPVTVEGRLTPNEVLDFDGITRAIYHLDGTSVK